MVQSQQQQQLIKQRNGEEEKEAMSIQAEIAVMSAAAVAAQTTMTTEANNEMMIARQQQQQLMRKQQEQQRQKSRTVADGIGGNNGGGLPDGAEAEQAARRMAQQQQHGEGGNNGYVGNDDAASALSSLTTTAQQQQLQQNSAAAVANTVNNNVNTIKVGFYEVDRTIGKGNYAVVKLARHRITKTEVAIKIVDKRRLDANNLAKVYREIEVLKKLRHPNIVRLYQVMETNNMLYLVTEYAPNGEIFDLISKQHRLSEENAREKFWQIISAVDYLHNMGIVHRDLKAENLLLDASFQIKLADFGFSNFYTPFDTLNTFCGSPPYAAPEVFEGKRYAGPEIDIWSLGVILYVMVCGTLPFEGVNLQLLRDRVLSGRIRIPYFMSTECEHLVRRMLTVDARRRPTIAQIKQHKWMRCAQFATKYDQPQSQPEQPPFTPGGTATAQQQQTEPHPQILRIMNNIGIESHKVRNALLTDAYDNFQAIYLLLLERLQQRGGSLSPSQSSSQANAFPTPPPSTTTTNQQQQQQQQPIAGGQMVQQQLISSANAMPSAAVDENSAAAVQNSTTKLAPVVVLTASPINTAIQQQQHQQLPQPPQQQQRLFRAVNARRQSDGVAIVGGGRMAVCHCCCCTAAALQLPIGGGANTMPGGRRFSQGLHAGIITRPGEMAMAYQATEQQQQPPHQYEMQQHQIVHQHASTSDYESENGGPCSGSSAAGSTLSRQSTIGTINSFDEGIPDDCNAGSGQLMFGGCAAAAAAAFAATIAQQQQQQQQSHPLFYLCGHEQLPSFDSQLSQDPLFSSQSSNCSAAAFRMDGANTNDPAMSGEQTASIINGCCCSSVSSSGVVIGDGTGDNLLRHVQLHCGNSAGQQHNITGTRAEGVQQQQQQHHYYNHQHHPHQMLLAAAAAAGHGHYHQHLLKPYWYPTTALNGSHQQRQQQQQCNSARAATGGADANLEQQQQAQMNDQQQQHHLLMFANQWRASDNAIGDDSLTFPTGQLGRCNRAQPDLFKPFAPPPQMAAAAPVGVVQSPNLYNQFHRMRISTGMATLAKAVPLAVGVMASPILSTNCTLGSGQCSPTGSFNAAAASSPPPSAGLDKQSPSPAAAQLGRHQAMAQNHLPKRISLPENLEFQPQMLLNLKQSIHVEKQLTGSPDDPCEMVGCFEKPMIFKASTRLQQYQQQQHQKRKAARLQLLRQQSYHMAQKQSVIAGGPSATGSPTALTFHAQSHLQIQTSSPVKKNFNNAMDGDAAADFGDTAAAQSERIPLSPIEDLKAEEVMDTS